MYNNLIDIFTFLEHILLSNNGREYVNSIINIFKYCGLRLVHGKLQNMLTTWITAVCSINEN